MMDPFRKTLVVGSSMISGGLIVFGIFSYFLSGTMSAKADKIAVERNSIRTYSELIGGLAKQKTTIPEVEKYRQAIDVILPAKDHLVNFSSWLDGLSRAHNVNIGFNFSGDAVAPTDTEAGYIRFVLNIGGDYSGLTDFLRDVEEKSPKYTVGFDDFDLKRSGNTYRAAINGRVFFK